MEMFSILAESEERGAGGHHPGQHGAVAGREGECRGSRLTHGFKSKALHLLLLVSPQWIQQIEGTEAALHQKMMDLEIEMVSHRNARGEWFLLR